MSIEIIIVFAIIIAALVLFVTDAIPVDLTAIFVMVALMVSGVLEPTEAVAGFSNTATVTILALLIISLGLKNTGAVDALGDQMARISGRSASFTIVMVMLISAFASAFVNNTAVVAVFIPVMFRISEKTGIHPALLLMPMTFSCMVGGSSTMIGTSTNLLINSIWLEEGNASFEIFKPALLGSILLVAAVLYMSTLGKMLLRKRKRPMEMIFNKTVDVREYITEAMVHDGSNLIGAKLGDTKLRSLEDLEILDLIHEDGSVTKPSDAYIIQGGDCFVIKGSIKSIIELDVEPDVIIMSERESAKLDPIEGEADLFEVLVAESSNLSGQRIKNVDFPSYYDAVPLAVKKKRLYDANRLMDHRLQYGDILLMSGKSHQGDVKANEEWVYIQQFSKGEIAKSIPRKDRMWLSIAIALGVVVLAVADVFSILVSAWLGVAIMFMTGCLRVEKAYDSIQWKVIFLIAGIIPLGDALSKTGGDHLIAQTLVDATGDAPLRLIVAILFAVTTIVTGIISNQATAVLFVPIALQIADTLGLQAEPLVLTVLFGASASFLTPVGYQTNAMILGPGNFRFSDFLSIGGILSLIFWALCTILIPILYGS